ncbi:NAD(P)H-dependent oxidoreductase [Pseudoalteromonas sp. DL2-H2.2]|uniref:NAD(P)H-dependent oxidoreductase n=1 Tax=Pseudoalteromonas sp. DL2-H2.2 TaxID=2908889 RepID=UPI001F32C38A|nr:NAD(P)H-dependent oxidoreductase [Pseudoalteromonas sp. DL2-H2.2]MCF2909471.1 NAD(P)H-dependent oxidoreductase [Pseudoalteromonas sp. DL2-H2.2]
MKKVLLLNGNPKQSSFSHRLSSEYQHHAEKSATVRRFNLSDMKFDPNLTCGYDEVQALEACLSDFIEALIWAEHIVIVAPVWWGGLPAKLKGLLDRGFLPGTAFSYQDDSASVVQLLTGKTARVILTMDAPQEFAEQQSRPVLEQLSLYTLEFCGINKAEVTLFGSVILSDESQRTSWLEEVQTLGMSVS